MGAFLSTAAHLLHCQSFLAFASRRCDTRTERQLAKNPIFGIQGHTVQAFHCRGLGTISVFSVQECHVHSLTFSNSYQCVNIFICGWTSISAQQQGDQFNGFINRWVVLQQYGSIIQGSGFRLRVSYPRLHDRR